MDTVTIDESESRIAGKTDMLSEMSNHAILQVLRVSKSEKEDYESESEMKHNLKITFALIQKLNF